MVQFVLDNKITTINFADDGYKPTTTVLQYLRSLSNHKGVKEGCAEGDCGACTVVIGELRNGKIKYKAIDSCLVFIPMLQGKQLITVENLGNHKNLHSVQQSMLDTDGSQCGYCTPGFIMSMFYLYKEEQNPSRATIDDVLTGNLCRCTGYRSIVEAASQSCAVNAVDQFNESEGAVIELLQNIGQQAIAIKTSIQEYQRPLDLAHALSLKSSNPDALVLSGATDIGLRVTKNKELLPNIIDLSGIIQLQNIEEHNHSVTYGAGTSLETIRQHCANHFPALKKMLDVFGSRQIRYLGTLGGNLGSASPIGDTPPVLIAYNAIIVLEGSEGKREVNANEFVTDYRQTVMSPDELIVAIRIPKVNNKTNVWSHKISKRKDLDISTVSAGFRVVLEGELVKDIALIYGGMAAMTKHAKKAEQYLVGKPWTRQTVEEAMPLIDGEFTPISDARSGKEARTVMARNLLLKFWSETRDSTINVNSNA